MPAEANAATVASTHVQAKANGVRQAAATPTKASESNTAVQFASIPVLSATAIGMEMQLGSLANLVSKLMGKARTTNNTAYYEILNAQIVKLQYQIVAADRKLTHLRALCRLKTDPGVLLVLPIFWAGNKQGDHHGNVGKNSTDASTRQGVAA